MGNYVHTHSRCPHTEYSPLCQKSILVVLGSTTSSTTTTRTTSIPIFHGLKGTLSLLPAAETRSYILVEVFNNSSKIGPPCFGPYTFFRKPVGSGEGGTTGFITSVPGTMIHIALSVSIILSFPPP